MKMGKVEVKLKEIQWPRKPKDPKWNQAFARKDCDCAECTEIIKHDAWFAHNDSGLTGQKLIDHVSKFNWEA